MTKEPTYMGSKPQVINNQFYGSNSDDNSLYDDTNFEVSNEAVAVSSPAYGEEISSPNYPTEDSVKLTQHGTSHSESFSSELPTRIYSSTMPSTHSEEEYDAPDSVQFSKDPYDHSDIAYSPSESEITMDNSNSLISHYPSSTPDTFYTETRTEATTKNKFSKPIFKLKPTQYPTSTEKYVLVHTISNDKQNENPTKKPTTNESIQSIILMLNGSNPGPEYDVDSMNINNNNYHSVTPSFGSTSMIDREKYGSSSYYITTKNPSNHPTTLNVPSTSYVYSPNPTRRQTTKATTLKNSNRVKITPTRSPQRPTTLNVPSTSYVYSANPITKRPTTAPSSSTASLTNRLTTASKTGTTNLIKKTTPKPMIIVKRPSSDVENGYVVISGGGITKHPSPTVHITPKPITNILTSSTMSQVNNQQTKRPSHEKSPTTPTVTERPPFYPSTSPATFISSSIYVPAIQDFHNEGYFVVTHRPSAGVSSTAIYTINSGTMNKHPSDIKAPSYTENDLVNFDDEVPVISNDDFSNFPPVRNPNLNMTGTNGFIDESQISTPAFVEDEQLNGKIDLLVNKLVASMQGNLDNLIDIVYERKNISAPVHDISTFNKNGSLLHDAKPTKSTPNPGKLTTVKLPSRITTGRPSPATTKKTPSKATPSTKKPSTGTKKPAQKPVTSSQTSKKPARVTTTLSTRKPTRKVSTTSTTERAPVEDEIIEEEGEEPGEGNEENEEDNNVEEPEENEATSPPLESGKIRKKLCSSLIEYTLARNYKALKYFCRVRRSSQH